MNQFGPLLRKYRRECRDPDRGGMLTQVRLGELIGLELGDAGYAGAAVAYWEQGKSKINEDDRLVLVALITVLHKCGGVHTLGQANELLNEGNYRDLNEEEAARAFPDADQQQTPVEYEAEPESRMGATAREPNRVGDRQDKVRRGQLVLLDKVKHFWVEGVLEHSTKDAKLLELSWQMEPEAVIQPWAPIIDSAAHKELGQAAESSIKRLFIERDRALLILGNPGGGKTTLLLILAKDLIERALNDVFSPIPVVLNLVSWESNRKSLADWVVEELAAKYQIPKQMGRSWLEDDQLTLLLDGFDEVSERYRRECAERINAFRQTHGLMGIAVCSRKKDYENTGIKLNLTTAIMVNVLSDDQVQEYLNAAGDQMTALKAMIEREQPLREMARTPLSLNVMRSAYSDTTDIDVSSKEKSALTNGAPGGEDEVIQEVIDDQAKLFDAYTDRMFRRYGSDPAYPPNLTVRYLGWLAEKLTHHNISIFLIERMQPSWLPTLRLRRIYLLTHGLVVGFVAGIMLWLYLQLIEPQNPVLLEDLLRPICSVLHIPNAYDSGVLLVLIMLNLILGLVSSAVSALFMERFERLDMDANKSRRLRWQRVIVTSLAIALLTVLLLVPFGPIESVLAWTAAEVIVYAVVARYIHGQSYASDIRVVESISWSWRWAGMEMVVGALLGYLVTRIGLLINPGDWTWNSTIIFGVVGIFIGGMRGSRVEERSRPNEGMYLSIRNAIFSALLTGPILGAVMWWFYSLREGIISGLLMMLVVFSLFGGSIVTKHLLLRMVLRRDRRSPWRYTRFLDHCCRLVFLRKVGGGYIFIHRSIQDYFCSKSPAEASQYR